MASNYIQDHNRLFDDLNAALNRDMAKLSTEANGGRSILFVYSPEDEESYIQEAQNRYTEGYEFVDLRELLNEFINAKGIEKFRKQFQNMGTEVFVSQNYSEGTYYSFLMKRIAEVGEKGISPILIHTGTIYNMGFSNQNIMTDPVVMKFKKPLVFFYPATLRDGVIYFLDKQPASNYRCVVII